jgi:hypothetical protein
MNINYFYYIYQMSDNVFADVTKNLKETEEKILGPQYDYVKNIKTPSELGMSGKGSFAALGRDIKGLIGYTELLVTGNSSASKTGKPLGNKFFFKTGAKCKDKLTGNSVDRYIYVNNVPDGSIPFITSGLDVNFTTFKGLVPGTMSNLAHINPLQILQSFMTGTNPECQSITMETIDVNNVLSRDTKYVTTIDIESMSPCWFSDKKNPVTKETCREAFSNILDTSSDISHDISEDIISKLYFSTLGIFGIYILIKLFEKKN